MKTIIIAALLLTIPLSALFSQKTCFSGILTATGGVHSPVDFAVDDKGYIYVAGGVREGLPVTGDAFQKIYNGHDTWRLYV